MGSHSFLCSDCEQPLRTDCHSGEHCILFLLEAGETLEWMQGQYNGYGRVFHDGLQTAQEWDARAWSNLDDDHPQAGMGVTVCALMHRDKPDDGIAAYHSGCYTPGMLLVSSDSDPDQGDLEDGRYQFPTKGSFDHGLNEKPVIRWTKATKVKK